MTLTLLKLLDFKNGIYMSVLLLKKKKKANIVLWFWITFCIIENSKGTGAKEGLRNLRRI